MHVHVLGLGSIGCLVAHHLRRSLPASWPISIIHKTRSRAHKARWENVIRVEHSGVVLSADGFIHESSELPTSTDPEHAHRRHTSPIEPSKTLPPIQSLIVCLKTYQTLPGISALSPRITPNTTIVLLQNGMGVYEQLVQKCFNVPEKRPNFVLATISHGAWMKRQLHVVHAGIGDIQLGVVPNGGGDSEFERSFPNLSLDDVAPDPEVDPNHRHSSLRNTLAALTSCEDLNASWRPLQSVHMQMRRKAVVNSAINPLTALMNCQNGQLFHHETARVVATKVCREAASAFYAQWKAEVEAAKISGEDVPYAPFPQSLSAKELMAECVRVAYATQANYSSMLTDIRMGRSTEIHSLNGYLIDLGKQYGLPMHASKMLMHLIKLRGDIPISPY